MGRAGKSCIRSFGLQAAVDDLGRGQKLCAAAGQRAALARALPENLLTRRRDQAVSARSRSITALSLDNKADLLPSTHSADHDLRSLPRNPPKTPHQSLVFARVFRIRGSIGRYPRHYRARVYGTQDQWKWRCMPDKTQSGAATLEQLKKLWSMHLYSRRVMGAVASTRWIRGIRFSAKRP